MKTTEDLNYQGLSLPDKLRYQAKYPLGNWTGKVEDLLLAAARLDAADRPAAIEDLLARIHPVEVARYARGEQLCIVHAYTRSQLAEVAALVRAQALEEAAQVCDRLADDPTHHGDEAEAICAAAIRALAGAPASKGE